MTVRINITFHFPVATGALLNGYLFIYTEQLIVSTMHTSMMIFNIW
jgi:hypothetical protein